MADITIASTLFAAIEKATQSAVANDVSKFIAFVGGIMGGLYMVYMLCKLLVYVWEGLDNVFRDWMMNMLKCCAITFVAVGNGFYLNTVAPAIIDLPDDVASSVIGNGSNASNLVDNILTQTVDTVFTSADALPSIAHPGALLLGLLAIFFYIIGALPFLSVVVATLIVNKIAIVLYAIVGPLFILFLLFPQFQGYFFSWLAGIFTFCITQFFFVVCITIQFDFVQENLIKKLNEQALTLSDGIIMLLVFSAFIVLSAAIPAFASGLFGGAGGAVTDGLGSMPFVGRPVQLAKNLGGKASRAGAKQAGKMFGKLFGKKIGG
ncbi:type IV secretion system protein [Enterobacter hormaechei]|uniref:type IV secretion system protein n=1 Tax=Enterobacter hormaechei TaxID=158836 RepID=UPI0020B6AA17|nr:type IV secretion system protein [Enterobacter hormaechei]UTI09416.1 type IV secretion system protein [Enterobacter hormaechei subsp. steigerwaltii]